MSNLKRLSWDVVIDIVICTPQWLFLHQRSLCWPEICWSKSIDKSLTQISLFDYLQVTVVCLLLQDMTGFHHCFGTALFLIYFDKMKIRLFLEWKVWVQALKNIETQQLFNKTNNYINFQKKEGSLLFPFSSILGQNKNF